MYLNIIIQSFMLQLSWQHTTTKEIGRNKIKWLWLSKHFCIFINFTKCSDRNEWRLHSTDLLFGCQTISGHVMISLLNSYFVKINYEKDYIYFCFLQHLDFFKCLKWNASIEIRNEYYKYFTISLPSQKIDVWNARSFQDWFLFTAFVCPGAVVLSNL